MRLREWQDEKLSVEALKPGPRLVTSFPPAPREYRGLQLRRAGRGIKP